MWHLQRMHNWEARVILRLPRSSSITTHWISLHWLHVKARSTYKITFLCYHCHSSTAPSYVADMLQKKPSHTRNTPSSSYTMPLLNRPAHSKATLVNRLFPFASSSVWNSILNDVRCVHHCHNLILVWRHTCFVQITKTGLYYWSLYICAWFGLVIALLMSFLKNALMCTKKEKKCQMSAYFITVVYNACILNVVCCFVKRCLFA